MDANEIKKLCKELKLPSGEPIFWCYPDNDLIIDKAVELSYSTAKEKETEVKSLITKLTSLEAEAKTKESLGTSRTAKEIKAMIDAKLNEIEKVKTQEESKLQISLGRSINDLKELRQAIETKYGVI